MSFDKDGDYVKRYGIDVDVLKREQLKISKGVSVKDSMDFDNVEFIGSFSNIIVGNKILSAIVVVNKKFEIVDQKFFVDKINFPYLAQFRSYRELPSMISAFNLLEQKPELVIIDGFGINHVRLGEASHFSLSTSIPSIAVTDTLVEFKVADNKIYLGDKEVGRVVQSKFGSKPLFVSPGSGISIDTSAKIISSLIHPPYKLPEVMKIARKYAKKISKEIFSRTD